MTATERLALDVVIAHGTEALAHDPTCLTALQQAYDGHIVKLCCALELVLVLGALEEARDMEVALSHLSMDTATRVTGDGYA